MSSEEKITAFDAAEYLRTDQAIADFVASAFETNDPAYVAHAMGVAARAKGMANIAKKAGLSREQMYRSLSQKGNPTLRTMLAVMSALGVEVSVRPSIVH